MKPAVYALPLLRNPLLWAGVVLIVCLFASDTAMAMDANPQAIGILPWEGPLQRLRDAIQGPVAFSIALLGIIACGATLIWGGEVSEFTRRIVYVVLVICLIVFASQMLEGGLFQGAVIPVDAASVPVVPGLSDGAGMEVQP